MVEATEASVAPEEVRRLHLEPGDRLIVRTSDMRVTPQQVDHYREQVQAVFPDNEVLVIVGDEIAVETADSPAAMSDDDMDRLANKVSRLLAQQIQHALPQGGVKTLAR